jgi:4-amino-4-deoxy-L-arabinose transferase-like glycosyltransferase
LTDLRSFKNNPGRILAVILVVSVLLRVAVAFYMGNTIAPLPGVADQESYHNLALRLLGGHGLTFGENWWPVTQAGEPTAHWSFLYTGYVTAVYAIFGPNPLVARLIQAIAVGLLMPWLAYRIGRRLFSPASVPGGAYSELGQGEWIGLAAAGITAVYIYFFYYAAALMTESFYIVAILWVMDLSMALAQNRPAGWRGWLLLGLALGVTVLLRQLFLLFIPFLLLWLWWAARPKLARLLAPLAITLLLMLPWMVRNYIAFDQFVLLNTNSGYAFYWGNHPIYGTKFTPILPAEMGTYLELLPRDLLEQGLNEAALDSALLKLALADIAADPGRYLLLSLSRIPPYFEFWPTADSGFVSNLSRVASFGLFLPFMLFGLGRTLLYRFPDWRARLASPFTLVYLFALVYTGIHVLTWTLVRYRLPIDALLVQFAALAFFKIGEWGRQKKA